MLLGDKDIELINRKSMSSFLVMCGGNSLTFASSGPNDEQKLNLSPEGAAVLSQRAERKER